MNEDNKEIKIEMQEKAIPHDEELLEDGEGQLTIDLYQNLE